MESNWKLWLDRLFRVTSLDEIDKIVGDFDDEPSFVSGSPTAHAFHSAAHGIRQQISRYGEYPVISREKWRECLKKQGYREEEADLAASEVPGIDSPFFEGLVHWFYTDKVRNYEEKGISMKHLTEKCGFSVPAAFYTLHILRYQPERGMKLVQQEIDPILARAYEEGIEIA